MDKTVENCNVVRAAKLIGIDKPYEIDGRCVGYMSGKMKSLMKSVRDVNYFKAMKSSQ